MKKRIVAISLLLVLVLGLCATASAGYYPSGTFRSVSKNQYVRYGKNITWKYTVDQGSGPFGRVNSTSGGYIWRANFDLKVKKGSVTSKIADYDFYGHNYGLQTKLKTNRLALIDAPYYGDFDKYQCVLTTYYRRTVGYTVYTDMWYKSSQKKTSFWVYR